MYSPQDFEKNPKFIFHSIHILLPFIFPSSFICIPECPGKEQITILPFIIVGLLTCPYYSFTFSFEILSGAGSVSSGQAQ